MIPLTLPTIVSMIALAIVGVAIAFKLYGATPRNFLIIVIGIAAISFILMKQTEVTYYTRLVLHVFMRVK